MAKKRSSSKAWLKEHRDDVYVQRAQAEGYRSRACYKLIELNDKDRFIRPGMTVVDLGSAPGGWSQVAAHLVGHKGRVVASDILPMDALAGVDFIEVGLPYSDPLADGPTIQNSSQKALQNGINLDIVFEQLMTIKENNKTPLVLMGYLNQMLKYGEDKFCQRVLCSALSQLYV